MLFRKKKKEETRNYSVSTTPQSLYYNAYMTAALGIPAVYSCVSLISKTIASMPIDLLIEGVKQDTHPLAVMMEEPYPNVSRYQWIQTIIRNLLINGNAYVLIIWEDQRPRAMRVIDRAHVVINYSEDMEIVSYTVTENGKSRNYFPEDILHFRGISKDERGTIGLSISEAFADLFREVGLTRQHTADYMEHGLISGLWLEIKGRVQSEQLKKIRETFKNLYQGVSKRNAIPTLTDGMQLHELQNNTLRDSAIDELKNAQLKEIAMLFNVPLTLLDGSVGNYAAAVEANLMFMKLCINPLLQSIAGELNSKINFGTSRKFRFDTSEYLAGTFAQKVETLGRAVDSGLLTPNEARERLGYAPHADGKTLYAPAGTPTPGTVNNEGGNQ